MSQTPFPTETLAPSLEAHLLGRIDLGRCLALERQVIRRIAARADGQVCLLLCEHPAVVAIGRGGSPAEVRMDSRLIRHGQLAAFGIAVRDWVTCQGAFINVAPSMGLFRLVEAGLTPADRMSCLVAERQKPVKMTSVRAELVGQLAEAFGCDRYHLYSGHPLLGRPVAQRR